ncbi:MAG: GNAT family N-acetyltransferase [Geminicoccaceae bacterium]
MAVSVRRVRSAADYAAVALMLQEMAAWDEAEVARLGLPHAAVIPTYYGDADAAGLKRSYGGAAAGLYLCRLDGVPAGCGAFAVADEVAEIGKVYVTPAARGRGVGRAILTAVLREVDGLGCRRTRLVTTSFMAAARAMYAAFGFVPCPKFDDGDEVYDPITVYLERVRGGA